MSAIEGVRDGTNIVETEPTVEELVELMQAMQRDWIALNDHLNRTATVHRWCSEYEERLELYNRSFTVLKLEGREQRSRGLRRDLYPASYIVDPASPDICTCSSCNEIRQQAEIRHRAQLTEHSERQRRLIQEALERLQHILQERGEP